MAAMKFSAVRNPNERWLMDLILLFIPSTAPLERRWLVPARIPARCPRSMRTNFLNGSSRERIAERIHFCKCSWLLVLKAQQSNFPPEDWTQIQTTMTSVEGQLDAAGKKRADEQCRTWMAAIAKSDMDAYSHQ